MHILAVLAVTFSFVGSIPAQSEYKNELATHKATRLIEVCRDISASNVDKSECYQKIAEQFEREIARLQRQRADAMATLKPGRLLWRRD